MATQTQTGTETKQQASHGLLATLQKEARPFQAFFTKFNNDWCMNLAAALAYNILTAIFPIAVALFSIVGLFLGDPQRRNEFIQQILSVLPQTNKAASQDLLITLTQQLSRVAGILGIIALLTAIFGGSRLFILMENCFCIIYRIRPRTFIRQNIMAIGMLLIFILLVPIMLLTGSVPGLVISLLEKTPLSHIPGIGLLFGLGGFVSGTIVSWILFQTIYVVVPNQKISLRHSWRGALVAALALELFVTFFSLYSSRFLNGYVGQVGFAIILLTFFYYFAVILLFGAEINSFFAEKVQPLPNDIVTFVSTMAGKLNQDIPDVESPSHLDPRPTDSADRAHIARERQTEEKNQHTNKQKQHAIASAARAQNPPEQEKKQAKGPSKLMTALEVVIGSGLALLIELFRLRQRGKM